MDIVYAPRTGISEGNVVLGDELSGGAEAAVNAAGVQYTVDASFSGKVKHPTITVSPSGAVSVTTAGGNGSVSLSSGTYLPSGKRAVTKRLGTRVRGRAHIHRHTPKVKVKRRKRKGHKGKSYPPATHSAVSPLSSSDTLLLIALVSRNSTSRSAGAARKPPVTAA
jgi:hypothetical protein